MILRVLYPYWPNFCSFLVFLLVGNWIEGCVLYVSVGSARREGSVRSGTEGCDTDADGVDSISDGDGSGDKRLILLWFRLFWINCFVDWVRVPLELSLGVEGDLRLLKLFELTLGVGGNFLDASVPISAFLPLILGV